MTNVTITTDHKWKNLVYRADVPKRVLEREFDYQNEDDVQDGFFCYRGHWYHLDQFMRVDGHDDLKGWHGYLNDSMCSGVLIELSRDGEQYRVGTFVS